MTEHTAAAKVVDRIEDVHLRGISRGEAAVVVRRIVGEEHQQERLDVAAFNSAI